MTYEYILIGLFGLMIGSFLNVVIYRLPIMLNREWRLECYEYLDNNLEYDNLLKSKSINLLLPRSSCPKCNHNLKIIDNIPILSYLVLAGKCRYCTNKISLKYPFVELLTCILFIFATINFGLSYQTSAALLIVSSLIVITFIDLEHTIIPDNITMPVLWAGILANMYYQVFANVETAILGAVVGYISLWSFYWLFKLLTGKEGMGHGDFKLLAMLGAWLGWQAIPGIVILSSVIGAIIGIGMIIFMGRNKNIPIPFGPYLAIAGFIYLFYGNQINQAYLDFAFGV
jgi:leader peptidase (prepilin peptidase) / N-methyltransferase